MNRVVLIRGGGDLASGVALRLHHAGFSIIITELAQPLAVRRLVAFSEAVYEGQTTVEDVTARLAAPSQVDEILNHREIPVVIDPAANILQTFDIQRLAAVVDARLIKSPPEALPTPVPLHIGLGPGFTAPTNCHAVVETQRGHTLGRVYWIGSAATDSRQPEGDPRRVLRSPADGFLAPNVKLGDHVREGQLIAKIRNAGDIEVGAVVTSLAGILRGLIRPGTAITRDMKIGDVDPRGDPSYVRLVSDKALAVGGGVLEAILTHRG